MQQSRISTILAIIDGALSDLDDDRTADLMEEARRPGLAGFNARQQRRQAIFTEFHASRTGG